MSDSSRAGTVFTPYRQQRPVWVLSPWCTQSRGKPAPAHPPFREIRSVVLSPGLTPGTRAVRGRLPGSFLLSGNPAFASFGYCLSLISDSDSAHLGTELSDARQTIETTPEEHCRFERSTPRRTPRGNPIHFFCDGQSNETQFCRGAHRAATARPSVLARRLALQYISYRFCLIRPVKKNHNTSAIVVRSSLAATISRTSRNTRTNDFSFSIGVGS